MFSPPKWLKNDIVGPTWILIYELDEKGGKLVGRNRISVPLTWTEEVIDCRPLDSIANSTWPESMMITNFESQTDMRRSPKDAFHLPRSSEKSRNLHKIEKTSSQQLRPVSNRHPSLVQPI